MDQKSQKRTPEQMVEAIFALDLDPIKLKLMDKSEGHGWTREQADRNELEYKRFLALLAKYPDQSIAPSTEVDKFWHGHILDTMKYADDCDKVFGFFLHHFPYFGMRGEEDAANLVNAFTNMQRLHDKEFGGGQNVVQETAWCGAVSGKAVETANQNSAWCGAVSGEVTTSAWCGAVAGEAVKPESPKAAWCGAASGEAISAVGQGVARCSAVSGETLQASQDSQAWCGATVLGRGVHSAACFERPTLDSKPKSA
jgi:hypothetical protein